ncbi:POU domain, class 4, transcription factor 2 [Sceloporus undulatus]|uniref:POU domain, class 4, transcription factor 2 n=1 Tax=Sceloporus undulatus TaxID=8520 RepID=UPI001C4C29B5|nr:POU domain, class 4, transcription factor 2 [Sceloporus undulatus]
MMMMSLSSKQPFALAHEAKYAPCPSSAAAPSAPSPALLLATAAGANGGNGRNGGLASPASSSAASSASNTSSTSSTSTSSTSSSNNGSSNSRACLPTPPSNIFGGLDESLLARAEALAAVDIVSPGKSHPPPPHPAPPPPPHPGPHHSPFKPDATYHTMNTIPCTSAAASSSSVPISHPSALSGSHPHPHHHHHHHHHPHHPHHHHHHQPHQALEGELLEHLTPGLGLGALTGPDGSVVSTGAGHGAHLGPGMNPMHPAALGMAHALPSSHLGCLSDVEADPRDLEAFAERFKQRRIKLGVTQADVGSALANLKIPGVGSLSQSTICRFESLTLSHNNMIALKPILQAWLEEAEKSHREKLTKPELFNGAEKKRKRTSIAAPEKRSLEAYFAIQPRPSSEKIAAIAEKLDLKKNVVRVWFCNQRQKQKRMKYSAGI